MRIVILYAPADRAHRDTLVKYLKPLDIELWNENQLGIGLRIDDQTEAQMNFADFVLVLVSPDSISDPVLLSQLKSLHNGQKVCLVPVILKPCLWDETVLKGLKPLPLDGQPILDGSAGDGARFFQVAKSLKGTFFGFGDTEETVFPLPPGIGFPKTPFPGPNWFEKADARIFFGRGQDIEDFRGYFEDVDPVLLLYGESGVGKSSFLRAGMIPRLEAEFEVRVHPRQKSAPLHEQLEQQVAAFQASRDRQLLILDQVEEIYTNPRPNRLDEEERFAQTLRSVIQDHPSLKVVLSFRKEYYVEIRRLLDESGVDYLEKPLKALDRAGVLEAITGLTKTASAQRKYRLQIESNVPFKIANDILGGDSAHIATFLQILLRKMWEAVVENEERLFSEELYAQLRSASFEELIDRQIRKIHEVFPGHESSGMVLAVLQACTTEYGTAGAQAAQDLREQYAHISDVEGLLQQLQQSLLLSYLPATDEYRLPHDSLAPLIIQRFLKSDRPVQRAMRLLENATSSRTGLSGDAFSLVQRARPWCRVFTAAEAEVLDQGEKRYFKETLRGLLQNNEVDRVLQALEKKIIELDDLQLFQDFMMISYRYKNLQKDWLRGVSAQNDYLIGHNQIVMWLEQFINELNLFDFSRVEQSFLEALLDGDLKLALESVLQGASEYGMGGTGVGSRNLQSMFFFQQSRLNQVMKALREGTMTFRDVLMSLSQILDGLLNMAYEGRAGNRLNLAGKHPFTEVYQAFRSGNIKNITKVLDPLLQSENLKKLQQWEEKRYLKSEKSEQNRLAHDLLIEIGQLHALPAPPFNVQKYTWFFDRASQSPFNKLEIKPLLLEHVDEQAFFQLLNLSFQQALIAKWMTLGILEMDEIRYFEDRLNYASFAFWRVIEDWNTDKAGSATIQETLEHFCAGALLEGLFKAGLLASSSNLRTEDQNQLYLHLGSLNQAHQSFYTGLTPLQEIIKPLYQLLAVLKSLLSPKFTDPPSILDLETSELEQLDKEALFELLQPFIADPQSDLEYTYLKTFDRSLHTFFPNAEEGRVIWHNRTRHALVKLGKIVLPAASSQTEERLTDFVLEKFVAEVKAQLAEVDLGIALRNLRTVVDKLAVFHGFTNELTLLEAKYSALLQSERLLFGWLDANQEDASSLRFSLFEFVQKLVDHYQTAAN